MLQADNSAGPDIVAPQYRNSVLPLSIPSTKLKLTDYNVPERLLQIFLSNYRGTSSISNDDPVAAAERMVNLVEDHIEDGSAEPINLSA